MRKGYDPIIAIAKDGMIAGVALGSDAVSEHEWGIDDLKRAFCSKWESLDSMKEAVERTGEVPDFDLEEMYRINKNLDHIFGLVEEGFFTISTVNNEWISPIRHRLPKVAPGAILPEFSRREYEKSHKSIATEWDKRNFRFCNAVYGDEKLIKKLKAFHQQLVNGKCAFFSVHGGVFNAREGKVASGLVIVDTTRLTYAQANHWRVMNAERRDLLELHKRSRLDVILARFRDGDLSKNGHVDAGYFWPMWSDKKTKQEVVYGFNPGYRVNADYFGPYTEGQLVRWFDHNMSYRLKRESPSLENSHVEHS
jgi:hypothetical protein